MGDRTKGWPGGAAPAWTKDGAYYKEPNYQRSSPQTPQDTGEPTEGVEYHSELTRYHHQAMAHHFAMMYHHHKLACETFMQLAGPEYDFRQVRPAIPPIPQLPEEYMRAYGDGLAYQEYVQDVEPYYPKPLTGGTVEDDEDEDDLVVGHDPTERDPALTEEEQDWLNRQLDNVVIDHVNKELAGAADEAPVPELICADGEEPTAEEMDRFIEQVEELEAWHAPMTSIYADEEKPDETKSAAKRSPKTSAEKAAAPESKKPGEAEEARASAAKDDKVAGKVPAAEKGAPSKESGSAAEGG